MATAINLLTSYWHYFMGEAFPLHPATTLSIGNAEKR